MKRTTALFLCALMLLSALLVACVGGGNNNGETTAPQSSEQTTTAATTEGTTVATTTGVTGPIPTPEKLVAEFEEKNVPLHNANLTPIRSWIDERTYIDLVMHGWPTICKGDGDTLYVVASARMGHVDPFSATVFYSSHDGGKTWSEPKIINDTPIDDRDAGIVYMGNGKLLVTYFTIGAASFMPGGSYEEQMTYHGNPAQVSALRKKWSAMPAEKLEAGAWMIYSDDYGQTWSEPVKSPVTNPHGPTVANNGDLIICGGGDGGIIKVYRSKDDGRTWEYQGTVQTPGRSETGNVRFTFTEAYIVQLRDGDYLVGIRAGVIGAVNDSHTLRVFTSYSEDGRNFTKAAVVPDVVGAPPHFLELSNGAVLLTYSYRGGIEDDEVLGCRGRVSYDGGKTWDEEIIITESKGDLGYPSTVELSDGTLITVCYQPVNYDVNAEPSVVYTRWRLVEPTEK